MFIPMHSRDLWDSICGLFTEVNTMMDRRIIIVEHEEGWVDSRAYWDYVRGLAPEQGPLGETVLHIACDRGLAPDQCGPGEIRVSPFSLKLLIQPPFLLNETGATCAMKEVEMKRAITLGETVLHMACDRGLAPDQGRLGDIIDRPQSWTYIREIRVSPFSWPVRDFKASNIGNFWGSEFEVATKMKGSTRYLLVLDDVEATNIKGFHFRDVPLTSEGFKREYQTRVKALESEAGLKLLIQPPFMALKSKPRWSGASNEWVSPVIVAVTSFAAGFVPLLRGGEIGRASFQVFIACLMVAHSSASSAMFLRHKKPKAAGLLKLAAAISMAFAVALFLPIVFRRSYEGV